MSSYYLRNLNDRKERAHRGNLATQEGRDYIERLESAQKPLQRRGEPSMRGRKNCATCGAELRVLLDPFCSARCCREWYGCPVEAGGTRSARANVRPDALRCTKCKQWKPDHLFHKRKRNVKRRGKSERCISCTAKMAKARR